MEDIRHKFKIADSYWFRRLLNPTKKDLVLTLVIWTLLPAPDQGHIISQAGNTQWLPGISPANFLYGLLSILHPISRLIMWGELPWSGFATSHIIDTLGISLLYLAAAYLISVVLMEKKPWNYFKSRNRASAGQGI